MAKNSFSRTDRIGAELRRLIGTMVHEAVRDSGLPSMSVSDVEVTKDFDVATVYVTALMPDQAKDGVKALNELAKEFRHRMSRTWADCVGLNVLSPDIVELSQWAFDNDSHTITSSFRAMF